MDRNKFVRLKLFLASVFPQRCVFCGKLIAGDIKICDSCRKSVSRIEGEICPKCGRGKKDCDCRGRENYFDGIIAPYYYEGTVRKGIHRYKFGNIASNSEFFAAEMLKSINERYRDINFDFITEVPMTDKAIKKRGYNQSSLLCKEIASGGDITYNCNVLYKLYETKKQHTLNYYARKGNLTGVYDVKNPDSVKDKTILLVDDISTTGETLNECSKMLWLYDAKAVYCVTIALTKPKKRKK